MSNIYTYEVDHGDDSPIVGAGTEVNGGKVTDVSFTNQLEMNQKAHVILESLLADNFFDDEVIDKLTEIQDLI